MFVGARPVYYHSEKIVNSYQNVKKKERLITKNVNLSEYVGGQKEKMKKKNEQPAISSCWFLNSVYYFIVASNFNSLPESELIL